MNRNDYVEELSEELSFHPDQSSIMEEYRGHIRELEEEQEVVGYEDLVARLGSPEEIARMWQTENSITESRLHWLFVLSNVVLFLGGGLLTLGYHLFEWPFLQSLWYRLLSIPNVIIALYFMFWALLGYEIGKAFGPRGMQLLRKTFLVGIVPNLSLMALTVFHIIPHRWFDPLITPQFILVCVVCTVILYPVSWIGCRWGRRMSL